MNIDDARGENFENSLEEFEWNESKSIATAWSTTHGRSNKGRRTYGRRGMKKGVGYGSKRGNKRALQPRADAAQHSGASLSDQGALSDSVSSIERASSISSVAAFDPSRNHSSRVAAPPLPRPDRIAGPGGSHHKRSKSISSLPKSLSGLMLQRSVSISGSAVSFPASSTSSSSLADWNENYDPNRSRRNSVTASPEPVTALRTMQTTPVHVDMDDVDGTERRRKLRSKSLQDSASFSSPANSTFSRLAKENGNQDGAWVNNKPPSPSRSSANTFGVDLRDANAPRLSPSPSASTSGGSVLGKRGVCGSPLGEDMSSSAFSYNQSSTSSLRSKSRSRIFSMDSLLKPVEAPKQSERFSKNQDPDDDDSDKDSGADDEASDSGSYDGSSDEMEVDNEIGPPLGVRRQSSASFEESVFGRKERQSFSPEDVFKTMSSYDDLKFLIKALRKAKKGSTSSFGENKAWMVALPPIWTSDRRMSFLHWATSLLGFKLFPGGASITLVQIAASRGTSVLDRLEAALVAHKQTHQDRPMDLPLTVTTIQAPDAPRLLPMSTSMSKPRTTLRAIQGGRSRIGGDKTEMELLRGLNSLAISQSEPMEEEDVEAPKAGAASNNPLVRLVTLDPSVEGPVIPRAPSMDPSPSRASFDLHQGLRPRLSDEHHVGGQDLMMHLHGFSPKVGRPPRLSTSSVHTATSSRPSGLPPRGELSPFVHPHSAASRGGQRAFTCADDGIETPLVKRAGCSNSLQSGGRDWGMSEQCPPPIIHELLGRLELVFRASGFSCESPFTALDDQASPCPMPADFSSTAINSSDLGFDFEVDKKDERITTEMEEDDDEEDNQDEFEAEPAASVAFVRRGSVGATALAELSLDEEHAGDDGKLRRRRMLSFAKHRRVSLCTTALPPVRRMPASRKTIFARLSVEPGLGASHEFTSLMDRHQVAPMLSPIPVDRSIVELDQPQHALVEHGVLPNIFSFLREHELLCTASAVCSTWADAATAAHASLMLVSVGCSASVASGSDGETCDEDDSDDESPLGDTAVTASVAQSMQRPWNFVLSRFPWACFLSEGAFKRVYKVWNARTNATEAVSVMDVDLIESTGNKTVVGAELAVSAMLSSLVRRNICPNFVTTRGVFTCPFEPPAKIWGAEANKRPRGGTYTGQALGRKPKEPVATHRGRYQYMRMELCSKGDIEEFLKIQPNAMLSPEESRGLLFQIAFSLHVAADRFSMKHYDVKLLNVFLQDVKNVVNVESVESSAVLRYALGSHVFALRMPKERSVLAKLADYGTANVQAESNGLPVTIAQLTTLENTPPEFMILGDAATQGHGHDSFGLGLCMLHLFTGHAPYEEILDDVKCPPNLKKNLRRVWEGDDSSGYDVLRSVILADVYEDMDGNVEGEPDGVLYDTLYRYLVLFGIPEEKYTINECGRVWRAIKTSLGGGETRRKRTYGRNARSARSDGADSTRFKNDRKKYSISHGNNKYIARARRNLQKMEGGMELLLSLVNFDPQKRGAALDVLNSIMMLPLREEPGVPSNDHGDLVLSYMAYAATT